MRSIGGEDSGRTLRETARVVGIKSKEIEMTDTPHDKIEIPKELQNIGITNLEKVGITPEFKKKWNSLHEKHPDDFVSFDNFLKGVAHQDRGIAGVEDMIKMHADLILKSILTFSIEDGRPKVKVIPIEWNAPIGWRTSIYDREYRTTLIILTKEEVKTLDTNEIVYSIPLAKKTVNTLSLGEIVYSIPLEMTHSKIPYINIVFRSWSPIFLCCVGLTKDITANKDLLESLMIAYYNLVMEKMTSVEKNKFEKSLRNGTYFLEHFLPKNNNNTTQGGRRKSRRTHRKSKRSKRTRRHRK